MLRTICTMLVLEMPASHFRAPLRRYPCVQAEGKGLINRQSFAGHASPALCCRWARQLLLSVGGHDLTLMQWSLASGTL